MIKKVVELRNGDTAYIQYALPPEHYRGAFPLQGLIFSGEEIISGCWTEGGLQYCSGEESDWDIVGIKQEETLPFAERKFVDETNFVSEALQGEPVALRNGVKAYVKFVMPEEYEGSDKLLDGYYLSDEILDVYPMRWRLDGLHFGKELESPYDIVGLFEKTDLFD